MFQYMSYVLGMNRQGMEAVVYPYFWQTVESERAVMSSVLSTISFVPRVAAKRSMVRTDGMVRLTGSCIPFFTCRNTMKAPSPG